MASWASGASEHGIGRCGMYPSAIWAADDGGVGVVVAEFSIAVENHNRQVTTIYCTISDPRIPRIRTTRLLLLLFKGHGMKEEEDGCCLEESKRQVVGLHWHDI